MITRTLKKEKDYYPLHDLRVIDGDTIQARIVLPFEQSITMRIRLQGWYADELTGIHWQRGMQAKLNLQVFTAGRGFWLSCPGQRKDKYGRVIGHLVHGHELVDPKDVLGTLQLSEAEHRLRKDAAKTSQKGPRSVFANEDGATQPNGALMPPYPHPERFGPFAE